MVQSKICHDVILYIVLFIRRCRKERSVYNAEAGRVATAAAAGRGKANEKGWVIITTSNQFILIKARVELVFDNHIRTGELRDLSLLGEIFLALFGVVVEILGPLSHGFDADF